MIVAAKALTVIGADLFSDRQLVLDAKADFRRQVEGKTYQSVMPAGQKPPLNYRNKYASGEANGVSGSDREGWPNNRRLSIQPS
jgi:hypothetical protein